LILIIAQYTGGIIVFNKEISMEMSIEENAIETSF